jgi:hypothetical protein
MASFIFGFRSSPARALSCHEGTMLKSLVSAVWTARFTPFVLVIAAIAATAGDAQARTPKINTLRSFVGALEPNNSVPVSVLYDEDAFDLSGTERWVTVGKGQEVKSLRIGQLMFRTVT